MFKPAYLELAFRFRNWGNERMFVGPAYAWEMLRRRR